MTCRLYWWSAFTHNLQIMQTKRGEAGKHNEKTERARSQHQGVKEKETEENQIVTINLVLLFYTWGHKRAGHHSNRAVLYHQVANLSFNKTFILSWAVRNEPQPTALTFQLLSYITSEYLSFSLSSVLSVSPPPLRVTSLSFVTLSTPLSVSFSRSLSLF